MTQLCQQCSMSKTAGRKVQDEIRGSTLPAQGQQKSMVQPGCCSGLPFLRVARVESSCLTAPVWWLRKRLRCFKSISNLQSQTDAMLALCEQAGGLSGSEKFFESETRCLVGFRNRVLCHRCQRSFQCNFDQSFEKWNLVFALLLRSPKLALFDHWEHESDRAHRLMGTSGRLELDVIVSEVTNNKGDQGPAK